MTQQAQTSPRRFVNQRNERVATMKNMKRILAVVLAIVCCAAMFSGCGKKNEKLELQSWVPAFHAFESNK